MELNELEWSVLKKLLDGDHPALKSLRAQLPHLTVMKREYTGAGFYSGFAVSDATLRAPLRPGRLIFGDVEGSTPKLIHGAGFLLYIDDGRLHMLEAYSYEEAWPTETSEFSLQYSDPMRKAAMAKLDDFVS